MGLFNKLFGGKSRNDDNPFPTRLLNLKYEISPQNGSQFAQQFVDAVKKIDEKELDYSIDSIDYVDQFLQRFRDERLTVNDFAETIFIAGCYVGQIFVNNNSKEWIRSEDFKLPEGINMSAIIIKLDNDSVCDPIAKAYKRFHNGEIDNISSFYNVFTSE